MKQNMKPMTKRMFQAAAFIALGYQNKHIADELGISIKTIEKHRDKLMKTFRLGNTADITRFAIINGILVRRKNTFLVAGWRVWSANK